MQQRRKLTKIPCGNHLVPPIERSSDCRRGLRRGGAESDSPAHCMPVGRKVVTRPHRQNGGGPSAYGRTEILPSYSDRLSPFAFTDSAFRSSTESNRCDAWTRSLYCARGERRSNSLAASAV